MRYLLDTHAYLWAIDESPRLSHHARNAIRNGEHELFLSAASLWEIAIKLSIGKLGLDMTFTELADDLPAAHGVEILPITIRNLDIVSRLSIHHRDLFDRLLVAQCLVEGMAIVSNDAALDAYGVERLW